MAELVFLAAFIYLCAVVLGLALCRAAALEDARVRPGRRSGGTE